ncbi:hypothetical protein Avbf_06712 [Armadillidium vulgare]|nr:hypothetical protein Avbf_06712 [Armadillidium vulgare]
MDTDEEDNLLNLLEEWKGVDVLILTSNDDGVRALQLFDSFKPCFYCRFEALDHSLRIDYLKHFFNEKLKTNILPSDVSFSCKTFLNVIGGLVMYCNTLITHPQVSVNENCITSFIWDLTFYRINEIKIKRSLTDEQINLCLFELGKRCYDCLCGKAPILGEEILPFLESLRHIFENEEIGPLILNEIFSRHSNFLSSSITYSVCHSKQQEVLAAFYVLRKNLDGTPLKRMVKNIKYDDELAICVAGLLSTFINDENKSFNYFINDEPEKREKKIERVVKNLVLHSDKSSDPIAFTMRVIHELQYNKYLISLFLRDSVFPTYLHIHDNGIYRNAIEEVCSHIFPSKIHLLIRSGFKVPELTETLNLIKNFNVELTLAEMNHVSWNSAIRSDELLSILFKESNIRIKDFIGCLEERSIRELHMNEVTKYLVCLRLRVCDTQTTRLLINVQRELKQLMWLEIDFDFSLNEVFELDLSPVKTPLIDLSFKNVSDLDVENLCNFLHSISLQFSGLHIHQSSVSPQGVTEILKYCYKRNMRLNADQETITKYRRYRFPELKNIDLKEELTDEKVETLIGYDDRHHYSDNEVRSSYVSTLQEVNCLKNFFGIMNVVYFIYTCSNYCVIKETNGNPLVKKNLIS